MRRKAKIDDDGCAIVTFDEAPVQTQAKKPTLVRKTNKIIVDSDDCAIVSFDNIPAKATRKVKSVKPIRELDTDECAVVDFTPVTLPVASEQQRAIIDGVQSHNLIVDSVAGSGKTTTSLHIASAYPAKRMLLLTYNSDLRKETRAKAAMLGLNNLTAHTFHSLGYAYISKSCATDRGLIKFIAKPKVMGLPTYDLIIIDECQDMKELFYRLVLRVLEESSCARLCVVGDVKQSIYGYAGADPRFISLASVLYTGFPPDTWCRHRLTTSYRVTREIAAFVNGAILKTQLIVAVKDGPKPKYTIAANYSGAANEISTLIASGYSHGDIFILAPSVRSTNPHNPIKRLANQLTALKIPIYIPINDDAKLDPDVARGKIIFSSFHQSKGLERDATIVLGVDASYFKFYAVDEPQDTCPNAMYVALTRAKKYLSVYHLSNNPPLPFIDMAAVRRCAIVTGECKVGSLSPATIPDQIGISALIRHITSESLQACLDVIDVTVVREPGNRVAVPTRVKQTIDGKFYVEDVSDITGTAIPAYYELMTTGKMTIDSACLGEITPPLLLSIANKYNAKTSGLDFKTAQVVNYDWLSQDNLNECFDRLFCEIARMPSDNVRFESSVSAIIAIPDKAPITITGRLDVITHDRVIEIKTVHALAPEHIIQLAIYAYCANDTNLRYHLYNILDDNLVEITINREKMHAAIVMLVLNKYYPAKAIDDLTFLTRLGVAIS